MTHPLTPREKVRKVIIDVMKPKDADITLGRIDTCTDAVLTALASGSGDHAELVEDAMDALQIIDAFPSNQGEVEGRITEKGDRMLSSCTRDVRRALEDLLAENAALRAKSGLADMLGEKLERRTAALDEAERKLAEADRKIEDLTSALRSLAEGNLGDMSWQANYETIKQFARNAISKEAERG